MIYFFRTPSNSVIATGADKSLSDGDISKLCWLYGDASLESAPAISGCFVGPRREMITPWSTNAVEITLVEHLGKVHLAHHGRHDVAGLEVEVVSRPIQVGGHYGDEVGAVLQIKALTHLQTRDFGNGIGLVGIFKR